MRIAAFWLAAACVSCPVSQTVAQVALRVVAVDSTSGLNAPGVSVLLRGPSRGVLQRSTDSAGVALFAGVPAGRYTLVATGPGFAPAAPVNLDLGGQPEATVRIPLLPDPVKVSGVSATAVRAQPNQDLLLNGFYNRQRFENGIFIEQKDIAEHYTKVSDMLWSKPGIQMRQTQSGEFVLWFRGSEGFRAPMCGPQIVVDGTVVHTGGQPQPSPIDNWLAPKDVAGVEVYRRPSQIPAQYGGATAGCGVVLIWTRVRG